MPAQIKGPVATRLEIGGIQVDHQVEFRWLLDRQVARFGPLQVLVREELRRLAPKRVLAVLLNQLGDDAGPPGLVAGA